MVVRGWSSALVLAGAMFLVLFDSLAVATALPRIGAEFAVAPAHLQWVVTVYSLSIGGLLVLGGRVCDLWGRRRLIVASLGVTTAGLLLAGVAPGLAPLLAGRALQGIGAAFALPAALACAATIFPDEPWRSRVFAVIAAAADAAGLAGAVVGGLITAHFGWRWIFLAVAPVGVLAMLAALWLLPADPPPPEVRERMDVTGAVLATGGLLALIYGASRIADAGPDPAGLSAAAAGALMLAGLVVLERRVAHPLVKPSVLRSRRLVASCLAFGAHSAAYAAVVVVGSLYLQEVHHLSAAAAGMVLAPVLLGSLASSAPAGWLIRRFGSRAVVATSLAAGATMLALVAANGGGPLALVTGLLIAWGVSGGPVYVALTRECVGDAAPADRGTASALFESTSHVGGAIAVAVFLSLIGGGAGYGTAQLIGAGIVAAGVIATLLVMPGPRAKAEPAAVTAGARSSR